MVAEITIRIRGIVDRNGQPIKPGDWIIKDENLLAVHAVYDRMIAARPVIICDDECVLGDYYMLDDCEVAGYIIVEDD